MKLHKKAVVYSALVLSASSMVLQLLGFLYRIILSRIAGAQTVGNLSLLMSVYAVIMSATLSGITMAVSRVSSEHHAFADYPKVHLLVKTAIGLFLLCLLPISIPYLLSSSSIAHLVFKDTACSTALILLIPCLFLTGFENIFKNCFYGVKFLKAPITSELTEQTVRIVSVALLLWKLRPDSPADAAALIVCGMIISELFSFFILIGFYRRNVHNKARRTPQKHTFSDYTGVSGKIIAIALPISAAGVVNNLLCALTNILIPTRLMDSGLSSAQAFSAFGTLSGMTLPMLLLPSAFIFPLTTVLVPRLAQGIALHNQLDVKRKASKAIHVTGLLTAPMMAMLVPLGPSLSQLLYKQPEAGYGLFPLAVANLFAFYQVITASVLNGIGEQKKASSNVLLTGVIELGFIWLFVGNPRFRLTGYVMGHLVSSVVGGFWNLLSTAKCTGLSIQYYNWFIIPVFCSLLCGCTARLIFLTASGAFVSLLWSVILSILGGGAVYLLALSLLGTNLVKYVKSILS